MPIVKPNTVCLVNGPHQSGAFFSMPLPFCTVFSVAEDTSVEILSSFRLTSSVETALVSDRPPVCAFWDDMLFVSTFSAISNIGQVKKADFYQFQVGQSGLSQISHPSTSLSTDIHTGYVASSAETVICPVFFESTRYITEVNLTTGGTRKLPYDIFGDVGDGYGYHDMRADSTGNFIFLRATSPQIKLVSLDNGGKLIGSLSYDQMSGVVPNGATPDIIQLDGHTLFLIWSTTSGIQGAILDQNLNFVTREIIDFPFSNVYETILVDGGFLVYGQDSVGRLGWSPFFLAGGKCISAGPTRYVSSLGIPLNDVTTPTTWSVMPKRSVGGIQVARLNVVTDGPYWQTYVGFLFHDLFTTTVWNFPDELMAQAWGTTDLSIFPNADLFSTNFEFGMTKNEWISNYNLGGQPLADGRVFVGGQG